MEQGIEHKPLKSTLVLESGTLNCTTSQCVHVKQQLFRLSSVKVSESVEKPPKILLSIK